MNRITILLEGKPVAKGRPRIGGWGKGKPYVYTPENTRKYEEELRNAAKVAMFSLTAFEGPLVICVAVTLSPPKSWSNNNREAALNHEIYPTSKPDLDNYVKTAMDGLNTIVYLDDSQIVRVTSYKIYGHTDSMKITVREM